MKPRPELRVSARTLTRRRTATPQAIGDANGADDSSWGGLVVAGLPLALPLAAIREVVPCRGLVPLPGASPQVIGGIDVRGVIVAVVELAPLLGREAPPPESGCAVLLLDRGRLLALRADGVNGIFQALPGSFVAAGSAQGGSLMFAGSVRRQDTRLPVNLLSMAAITELPALPWIDDPESRREGRGDMSSAALPFAFDAAESDPAAPALRSLMLLRCGVLQVAVDALRVHATLWEPLVKSSPLARGACRGVVELDGRSIAAVELSLLCGLHGGSGDTSRQAIVLRHERGLVAVLVDAVVEIVRVPADAVTPLAGLPMFGGMLPAGTPVQGTTHALTTDAMVIDDVALLALDEVAGLAGSNTGESAAVTPAGGAAAAGRALVTLRLPAETAVPLEQIAEILPYGTRDGQFGDQALLRRVQVLRGRSVPVICLSRALGLPAGSVSDASAVLVVESAGRWLGFGVPTLDAIEQAQWERSVAGKALAGLGQGPRERTVPVLDLCALADAVLSRGNLLAA